MGENFECWIEFVFFVVRLKLGFDKFLFCYVKFREECICWFDWGVYFCGVDGLYLGE